KAVEIAAARGLEIPLVYNTGGYEELETLRLLDGVVDIYMPDMKYGDEEKARLYSGVADYVAVNRAAVKEMQRQVGDLVVDERGLAVRGLIIRHLILPADEASTAEVLAFIAREISPHAFVNLMDQYYPAYRAWRHPPLDRRITPAELEAARRAAREVGLTRVVS
ncbi:MAG: radical SAM protein, partial [Bacillota bacterium]|nr:radical SAM protein [Bacillota bacterium]